MMKKSQEGRLQISGQDFLDRFDRLSNEVPVDDEEADQLLLESNIDVDDSFQRLLSKIPPA